jgi:hypothetical protein
MKIIITEQQFNLILLGEGARGKYGFKLKDATVDDVVNFIKKNKYKSRTEFSLDKVNGGLSVYGGVKDDVRNKALAIVFPIRDRFKFKLEGATVDDVVDFIRSGGYKTKTEFRTDKINGGSRVYNGVDSDVRNKALAIVFPKKKLKDATVDDVVDFIKSKGYKTLTDFRTDEVNGGRNIYSGVDSDVRNKALAIVFPNKYEFKLKDATVDDVVNFIRKYGYKTRSEFSTDKVHGGLSIYTGVKKTIRNKALDIVFPIGDRFKFDVNKATVDDVVEFIRSGGYKNREEFRTDKVNGGSRVYGSVDSDIRNKALSIVFPKKKLKDATVDDVVNFIRKHGYKTSSEFAEDEINNGQSVYLNLDPDVREQALNIVFPNNKIKGTTVDNKEKRYYNNQTSSYPDISFKYNLEESVRKILKTMI